jgi:hypothetical protein
VEELQLDRSDPLGFAVLRRRVVVVALLVVVGAGFLAAWGLGPNRGDGAAGQSEQEQRLRVLTRAVEDLPVDPCEVPTTAEVRELVGQIRPEASTDGALSKQCRWSTTLGTLQVLVSPHGAVFERPRSPAAGVPVEVAGARAVRMPGLTLDVSANGSSIELEVGDRFGSVGLARDGPVSEADRAELLTIATRLAHELG